MQGERYGFIKRFSTIKRGGIVFIGNTLAVVYSNNSLEFKSLNLWTGIVVVSPTVGITNILLTGFKTSNETLPSGKLFVSAQEDDSVS